MTRYTDSVFVDSTTKDIILYGRSVSGGATNYQRERIDSMGNVYNLNYQSTFIRYKLIADTGDSWQAGVVQDTIPVMATVLYTYRAIVQDTTHVNVKAIGFQFQSPAPPYLQFALGIDHLAYGLGLIKSEVEPSDAYVLTGAIINGLKYGTIVSVDRIQSLPEVFDILTNYPNPFNGSTTISYSISKNSRVNIVAYNALGQIVATIVNEDKEKGSYETHFDADGLASGVYFLALRTNSNSVFHKLLLLK